ncbi:MAG: cytochrome c biogenesis protein CcsA [Planctomycetia bacterium]|nr:cytochrome c biogenesis protein CcsA [Planctomycetia bacterium]
MSPLVTPVRPPAPRRRAGLLVAVAVAAVGVALAVAGTAAGASGAPARPWPADAVSIAARLPIQEGGRIMPLATFADVLLLRLNHKKGGTDAEGNALTPTEILLDILLRPERAQTYPIFVVDDDAVLDAVGMAHVAGKNKRDRYSLTDLYGARDRLWDRADAYARLPRAKRTHVEDGVVELRDNVRAYLDLRWYLEFARGALDPKSAPGLIELFPDGKPVRFTQLLVAAPRLRAATTTSGELASTATQLLESLSQQGALASRLASIPPAEGAEKVPTWLRPSEVIEAAVAGAPVADESLAVLRAWEAVAAAADEPSVATEALRHVADQVQALAEARGEGGKVGLEVFLNRLNPFRRALWGYLLGFLVLAATWMWRPRWLVRVGVGLTAAALLLNVAGIVIRCVLRDRPPMSTLYETTLFIAAFAATAALVVEWISRRGIALAVAPFVGALGLFVSNRYEEIHASDTMPQLRAVLDTNFWLSTHVTCIGIGYAATLLASAFAHVTVLGRIVAPRWMRGENETAVARMTYGIVCFALVFSVVGTILGGIWANDSWGRFWGWDPKENGALLICLVQLAALHGRMGGLFRTFGFAQMTIFGGMVVAFSWWGVNLLEIGLHSYGFTKGVWTGLLLFWGVEAAAMVAGGVHWLRAREAASRAA